MQNARKAANNANGKANANEKPNIPMSGPASLPPAAASTNSVPMMGPVHENDTNESVKAMKNIPTKPPLFSLAATLFTKP